VERFSDRLLKMIQENPGWFLRVIKALREQIPGDTPEAMVSRARAAEALQATMGFIPEAFQREWNDKAEIVRRELLVEVNKLIDAHSDKPTLVQVQFVSEKLSEDLNGMINTDEVLASLMLEVLFVTLARYLVADAKK
jgi:hypothetical protein